VDGSGVGLQRRRHRRDRESRELQSVTCGPGAVGFSAAAGADVTGFSGTFAGGRANVDAFIFACGAIGCATDEVSQTFSYATR
jgi:hypothetical protein